jgi:hypothetical protein
MFFMTRRSKTDYTEKPRFKESEGTKDLVLYSRGFVIAGAFSYEINYGGTLNQVLYSRNFVIEGVVITRFQCSFTCLLRFMSVVRSLSQTKIGISQLCAVQLGWNLVETSGWYPRLACRFWFQDLFVSLYCKQKKEQKTPKSWFYKTCVFSALPS